MSNCTLLCVHACECQSIFHKYGPERGGGWGIAETENMRGKTSCAFACSKGASIVKEVYSLYLGMYDIVHIMCTSLIPRPFPFLCALGTHET